MSKQFYISFIFLGFSIFSCLSNIDAQITVQGTVYDIHSGDKIVNVSIVEESTNKGVTTSKEGEFYISTNEKYLILKISHIGFQEELFRFSKDTIINIYLVPRIQLMDEVEITAVKKREIVLEKKKSSVLDFLLLDDQILILEYLGSFKHPRLLLLNEAGEEIHAKTIEGIKRPIALFKSCTGAVYLETPIDFYPIVNAAEDSLAFDERIRKSLFESQIKPCQFILEGRLYFLAEAMLGNIQGVKSYDPNTGKLNVIHEIIDQVQVEHYKKDFGKIEIGQTISSMGTTNYAINQRIRRSQQKSDFLLQVEYPPNHPHFLFKHSDNVVLFDHLNKKCIQFKKDGKQETDIRYSLKDGFCNLVLQDATRDRLYTLYEHEDEVLIAEYDLETGLVEFTTLIDCPLPLLDKIRIKDGTVYYLSYDEIQSQKKVLKKVKL